MTTVQEPTLTVLYEGSPIFTSHGKWLHPLFELEDYLAAHCGLSQIMSNHTSLGRLAAAARASGPHAAAIDAHADPLPRQGPVVRYGHPHRRLLARLPQPPTA